MYIVSPLQLRKDALEKRLARVVSHGVEVELGAVDLSEIDLS